MSMFDQPKVMMEMPSANQGGLVEPPRPIPLTERVITHDQRITSLEGEIRELREALMQMHKACVHQLGLNL